VTLSIKTLTDASMARLPHFKNRRGGPAHSEPDGSDWALSAWSNAVLGELGEAAGIIKKLERCDYALDETVGFEGDEISVRDMLGKELADVQCYLVILARRAGIDLEAATIAKWNEVSERVGYGVQMRVGMGPGGVEQVVPIVDSAWHDEQTRQHYLKHPEKLPPAPRFRVVAFDAVPDGARAEYYVSRDLAESCCNIYASQPERFSYEETKPRRGEAFWAVVECTEAA
jgi:NTP pyrophosphatase (non-canonical NTP hydrolase)